MKIICNNGEGREKNPFKWGLNIDWHKFEKTIIKLPVYDQSGKLFTGSGEVNCELINQFLGIDLDNPDTDIWYDYTGTGYGFNKTRKIYRISDPIPEDFQKEKETKPSELLETYIANPMLENFTELSLEEPGEEESVEEAANGFYPTESDIDWSESDAQSNYKFEQMCLRNAFKLGAKWQKSQHNLIEKEKVIELLEAEIKHNNLLATETNDHRFKSKINTLTDLLTKIKEL